MSALDSTLDDVALDRLADRYMALPTSARASLTFWAYAALSAPGRAAFEAQHLGAPVLDAPPPDEADPSDRPSWAWLLALAATSAAIPFLIRLLS